MDKTVFRRLKFLMRIFFQDILKYTPVLFIAVVNFSKIQHMRNDWVIFDKLSHFRAVTFYLLAQSRCAQFFGWIGIMQLKANKSFFYTHVSLNKANRLFCLNLTTQKLWILANCLKILYLLTSRVWMCYANFVMDDMTLLRNHLNPSLI